MTIKEQLRQIQRLTGQSQESLASELGVSFPTLNSWINGKSNPRKAAVSRITDLYLKVTGLQVIPASAIEGKKQGLYQKRKKFRNVLERILSEKDICDQFVLSLTFNTNRIEGSTLTEPETAAILFQNASLPDKSIIEQLEVKNHEAALLYLFNNLVGKKGLTEDFILRLHLMLMNGIQQDAGSYRRHAVRIVGANVPTANYLKLPVLMKSLSQDFRSKNKDPIAHAAAIHSRFEQIHPFSDGNGRVGRLLLCGMLLQNNLPPAIIRQEKRQLYIRYLNKSQTEGDFSLLEYFICDAILEGLEILTR